MRNVFFAFTSDWNKICTAVEADYELNRRY